MARSGRTMRHTGAAPKAARAGPKKPRAAPLKASGSRRGEGGGRGGGAPERGAGPAATRSPASGGAVRDREAEAGARLSILQNDGASMEANEFLRHRQAEPGRDRAG